MTPSEVALEAARLISERGLAKGLHEDFEGHLCHNGAIRMAVTGTALSRGTREQAELILEVFDRSVMVLEKQGIGALDAPEYNDRPHVSLEDVVLLLKYNAALDDDPEAMEQIRQRREEGKYNQPVPAGISFTGSYCFVKADGGVITLSPGTAWIVE